MPINFDSRKSLQDLEGDNWGEPNYDSHLVQTCHRLRRVPLTDFKTEDLRIMIGQKIGLRFLVPLALEKLEQDPLVEGDFYPGDLLNAVLGIPESFWIENTSMREQLRRVVTRTKELLISLDDSDAQNVHEALAKAPASITG